MIRNRCRAIRGGQASPAGPICLQGVADRRRASVRTDRVRACHGAWPANPASGLTPRFPDPAVAIGRCRCRRAGFAPTSKAPSSARIACCRPAGRPRRLMAPQDRDYRAFIVELHRAHGGCRQQGRADRRPQAADLCRGAGVAGAGRGWRWPGFWFAPSLIGELAGILFLLGFAALFAWQIGGFVRRNRPQAYTFDHLPEALLP